jgi:hypothetical protein
LSAQELHASSPGLLGGEAHEDASSKQRLFARIGALVECGLVDALCTDWPDEVNGMLPSSSKEHAEEEEDAALVEGGARGGEGGGGR